MSDDDKVLAEIRNKARREVQCAFAILALAALGLALIAHHAPDVISLELKDANAIANAFLLIGSAYVLIMLLWDRLFPARA